MTIATIIIPPELLRLPDVLQAAVVSAQPAIALAVSETMRGNFLRLQAKPNRLGGERTNFWLKAADAVQSTVTGLEVNTVCAHRGVRLHLKGGTVRPKGTSEITGKPIKFLTIPRVAAAHGKTAATLKSLGVILYPGPGGLYRQTGAERAPATPWSRNDGKRQSSGYNAGSDPLYFIFAKSATITANAAVLPSAADVAAACKEAAENAIAAQLLA